MAILGITNENPTFVRSKMVNVTEEIQVLVQAAQYLSSEYLTKRILTLFGDLDKVDEVLDQIDLESASRFSQTDMNFGE